MAFFEDNLLSSGDSITHHGEDITVSEEMTPSLENMVLLLWLERIHTSLPGLIKQKYGAELRNKTLASLKSEISQSIDSLLEELKDDSKVMRMSSYKGNNKNNNTSRGNNKSTPFCCLCHAARRSNFSHWLSKCPTFQKVIGEG